MPTCIIANCNNNADNYIGVRLRRPDTSAVWAPNTEAYVCDAHSVAGMRVEVTLVPTNTHQIETRVTGGDAVSTRITPIVNPA